MLSRLSAVRCLPRTFAVRCYTNGRTEGAVAQSQGFSKKEKAHEDKYIRQQEMDKLKKLMEKMKAELKSLEEARKELEEKELKELGKEK